VLHCVRGAKGRQLKPECKSGEISRLFFEYNPFTVKPGEIVPQKFVLRKHEDGTYGKLPIANLSKANSESKELMFAVCLWINYVTADGRSRGRQIPLTLKTLGFDKREAFALPTERLFKAGEPHVLFQRSTTIFN
jgi:hypothetical protein